MSELRKALEALADKMGERCGDHCSNSCWVCELRNDLLLILVRTASEEQIIEIDEDGKVVGGDISGIKREA